MEADELIKRMGGSTRAATILNTTKQNVNSWRSRGVPDLWMRYIELAHPEVLRDDPTVAD